MFDITSVINKFLKIKILHVPPEIGMIIFEYLDVTRKYLIFRALNYVEHYFLVAPLKYEKNNFYKILPIFNLSTPKINYYNINFSKPRTHTDTTNLFTFLNLHEIFMKVVTSHKQSLICFKVYPPPYLQGVHTVSYTYECLSHMTTTYHKFINSNTRFYFAQLDATKETMYVTEYLPRKKNVMYFRLGHSRNIADFKLTFVISKKKIKYLILTESTNFFCGYIKIISTSKYIKNNCITIPNNKMSILNNFLTKTKNEIKINEFCKKIFKEVMHRSKEIRGRKKLHLNYRDKEFNNIIFGNTSLNKNIINILECDLNNIIYYLLDPNFINDIREHSYISDKYTRERDICIYKSLLQPKHNILPSIYEYLYHKSVTITHPKSHYGNLNKCYDQQTKYIIKANNKIKYSRKNYKFNKRHR